MAGCNRLAFFALLLFLGALTLADATGKDCKDCDTVLKELEKIDDETDQFDIPFVKINDKKVAKQYGVTQFPALVYFRDEEPLIYSGDLADEEASFNLF